MKALVATGYPFFFADALRLPGFFAAGASAGAPA